MPFRKLPDIQYLRECFECDPAAGTLTWKDRPVSHFPTVATANKINGRQRGVSAGTMCKSGYISVGIDRRMYRRSRLVWYMTTDREPISEIDHRNGDVADDRKENLRESTHQENMHNLRNQTRKSLPKGIIYRKDRLKFRASIKLDGRTHYLGHFDTPELARAAHQEAAQRLHGKFWNPG